MQIYSFLGKMFKGSTNMVFYRIIIGDRNIFTTPYVGKFLNRDLKPV